jgi:membrane-associated phospholipid phosphatase
LLRRLDLALLRSLRGRAHAPGFERAVLLFTRAGEHGAFWQALCLVGALSDRRRRPDFLLAMGTVLVAYLTNIALKYVVRRRRPVIAGLAPLSSTVTSLSFPSAHSTTSFAAARCLASAGLPPAPLYSLAGAMALSRVYAGVHYPSDIVAGATLGTALAELLDPSTDR